MKNTSKKFSVSIGIPAYLAEQNISNLLHSLVKQKQEDLTIDEILVYSDGSTDKTVEFARAVKDRRIIVIDSKKRKGMAYGFKYMLSLFKGDAFLLLNDDIKLTDERFVAKLVKRMRTTKNVGLIGGNPQPLKPRGFIGKSGVTAMRAYEKMAMAMNSGNNRFTCDAKSLLLTRAFVRNLKFPHNLKDMGNVDDFLYFSCISEGFLYRNVRNANVWFRYPDSLKDYVNWVTRSNANFHILNKRFGNLVGEEYKIPQFLRLSTLAQHAVRNPISCSVMFILGLYCRIKASRTYESFSPTWNVIASTKHSLY